MTLEELEIAVGDLTFRAQAAGPTDGDLVLLLHGFPESSSEWRAQIAALAEAGYRAVAPDQRGYSPGARPIGAEHYDVDLLVGDALGLADALGVERFHLVGHDWGAIVAWHLAARFPGRLHSLTAVSVPHPSALSSARADGSSAQREKSGYIAGLRAPDAADRFLADDAAGLRFLYSASGLDERDAADHIAVLTQPGAMDAACNWYRALDFRHATAADVSVPTLFVWSTDDVAIAREGAERTAEHVTGPYRFEVLEGVSHWIPEVAAPEISRFLLEHLAARRPAVS